MKLITFNEFFLNSCVSCPSERVSLELSDQCHRQNSQPLAMSVAQVEVNFTSTSSHSEFTQNDSHQGTGLTKHSIRKPSRGKEQRLVGSSGGILGIIGAGGDGRTAKKDLSSSVSGSGMSVNDITGIPLKDDSSRASRPSAHMEAIPIGGFGSDKGWTFSPHSTPLEVAMYVLLGVFSVAILVFVASCVVYASRVKKRELSHIEGLSGLAMKFDPRTGGVGGASANAQHDWIWLGRTSLALHPSLDAGQAMKHYTTQSSKSVSFDSNNSMNPIRIITNPNFDPTRSVVAGVSPNRMSNGESSGGGMLLQQQQNIPQGTGFLNMNSNHTPVLTPSPNPVMAVPPATAHPFARPEPPKSAPPRPPKPSSSQNSNNKPPSPIPFDTTTFSVKPPNSATSTPKSNNNMNHSHSHSSNNSSHSNGHGHSHKGRHRKHSDGSSEYRPPVPPHRNLPSTSSSAAASPLSPEVSPPRSVANTPPKKHSRRSPKLQQQHGVVGHQPQITHRIRVTKANRSHRRGGVNCDQEQQQDPDELPNPSYIDFEPRRASAGVEKEKKQKQAADEDASEAAVAAAAATTVIGNPMCYIDEEEDDDEESYGYDYESEKRRQAEPLNVVAAAAAAGVAARQNHKVKIQNTDNVKLNLDYDKLMEYFDSLKESEA